MKRRNKKYVKKEQIKPVSELSKKKEEMN